MARARCILFIFLLAFLFLILTLFTFRLTIFRWLIKELGRRSGVEIHFSEIKGSLFSNLTISDLKVSLPNGAIFTTQSLFLRYPPSFFWQRRKEVYLVSLEEPKLFFLHPESRVFSGATPFKTFPFSLRIHQILVKKGGIFSFPKLGFFDFTGEVIFESGRLIISGGKLATRQGKADFDFDYNLLSQKGEFNISALSFVLKDELKHCSGKGDLRGKGVFSLRERGIMGIPKVNGFFEISLASFRFKRYLFGPCSLKLNFQDTLFSYEAMVFSPEFGLLKSEGLLFSDTTYNLHFSLFGFDWQRLGVPMQRVSGELAVKGKGRGELDFSTHFRSEDLAGWSLRVIGRVVRPFNKERGVIVKEGRIFQEGGSLFFTGSFYPPEITLNLLADNFHLTKGAIPFGFFKDISTEANGSLVMKGSFDSLTVEGSILLASFSWAGLKINSCSLGLNFSNLFNLEGEGEIRGEEIEWGRIDFDSVSLLWSKGEMNLSIFKSPDTTLNVGLRLDRFSFPNFSISVNKFYLYLSGDSVFSLKEFVIKRVADSLFLSDFAFSLAGGKLEGDLIFLQGQNPFGRLVINDLVVDRLIKGDKVQGVINGFVSLDTVSIFNLTAKEFTLPKGSINIKDLKIELRARGSLINFSESGELEVTNISFINQGKISHLSGYITLAKGRVDNWDITATLNDPGPWVFSFLARTLHLQEGEVFGKVRLRGNERNPSFDGRVRVTKGRLFFPSLAVTINDFSSELSLFQDEIILLEGRGKVDRGEVRGSGFLKLKGLTNIDTLHYDIELTEIPINLEKEVFGIFAGKFGLDWTPSSPLYLSGNLSVIEGLINIPFGRKVSRGSGRGGVGFDFRIEGSKGIWFRNQNADLELGIDLRVKKEREEMTLAGELITRRGQLYYLDRTLQIKEGRIIFDNITEIDPKLDLRAELETKPIKIENNLPQRFRIIFLLQGSLSQPEFKLLSEPPLLSESDIITYLTLNVSPEELKVISEREFFYSVLSERILSYFERTAAKRLRSYLSLDYLSLEQGGTEKGTKITVGKYLARNLYLTYSALIGEKERDEYKAEYYLTKKHLISAEKTGEGRYIVKYQFQVRY